MAEKRIIDLDVIDPGTFTLRMKGKEYILPRSAQLDEGLKILNLFQKIQNPDKNAEGDSVLPADEVEQMFARVGQFISSTYPEIDAAWLRTNLSFRQGATLLREISGELISMAPPEANP